MNIDWRDYQVYVSNLSSNYGVYMTPRELPTLTNGIVEELTEVREAIYCAENFCSMDIEKEKMMISTEIGDCLAYVMILASRFAISADDIVKASLLNNESREKAFITALKVSGLFKRVFRGDYLPQLKDDFSMSALNTLYTKDTFLHTLTQGLGWVFYYLQKVAYEFKLDMDTIKRANMAKGAYLAEKTAGKSHFSGNIDEQV